VICIEEPVEAFALPRNVQFEARGQGTYDRVDLAERDVVCPSGFHPPHHRPRDFRGKRKINLAPSPATP
jgi:hypothetical protein